MPESPQMKALGERIADALLAEPLKRLDLLHFAALKTVSPDISELSGRTLDDVSTRGKYLVLRFGL